MANRYAVANGLWSDTATWDGGTLPTSADNVYANNYDINIDQDVTVLSLSNDGSLAGYTDGGSFRFVDGYTVSGNILCGGTESTLISDSGVLNSPIYIYGDIYFTTLNSSVSIVNFTSSTGDLNIIGDIYQHNTTNYNTATSTGVTVYNNYGDSNILVSGNITGGTTNHVGMYVRDSNANLDVFGDITGGSLYANSSSPYGLYLNYCSGNFNITGNITGGGPYTGGGHGLLVNSCDGSNLVVNGNVTGGASSSTNPQNVGIYIYGVASAPYLYTTINGNITGGTTTYANYGFYSDTQEGPITVNGNIYGDVGRGLYKSSLYGDFTLNGNSYGGNSSSAYGFLYQASGNHYINGSCIGGGNYQNISNNYGGYIDGRELADVTALGEHKPGRAYGSNGVNQKGSSPCGLILYRCNYMYCSGDLLCDNILSNTYTRNGSCLHVDHPADNSRLEIIGNISGASYGQYINGFSYNTSYPNFCDITISGNVYGGGYNNGSSSNEGIDWYSIKNPIVYDKLNIYGNVYAGDGPGNHGMYTIRVCGSINGDIVGSNSTTSNSIYGSYTIAPNNLTINGDIYGGKSASRTNLIGVYFSSIGSGNVINGNIYAASGQSTNRGVYVYYDNYGELIGSLTINGNIYSDNGVGLETYQLRQTNITLNGDIINLPGVSRNNVNIGSYYDATYKGTNFFHYGDYISSGNNRLLNSVGNYIFSSGKFYDYTSSYSTYPFYYGTWNSGDVNFTNENYIQSTNMPIIYLLRLNRGEGYFNLNGNFKGSDTNYSSNRYLYSTIYLYNDGINPAKVLFNGNYKAGSHSDAIHSNYSHNDIIISGILHGRDSYVYPTFAWYEAGSIYGGAPAIPTRVTKAINGPSGAIPFFSNHIEFDPSPGNYWIQNYANNTSKTLTYDGEIISDYPDSSKVKEGVSYKNDTIVGTMKVPSPQHVALGIPVEDTSGTAVLTQENVSTIIQSSLKSNATTVVERSPSDQNAITFDWPASGQTITGNVSINNSSPNLVSGVISFLRTETTGKHLYTLGYSPYDRPSSEGSARYVMTDGLNSKSFTLRVEGLVDTSSLALENSVQTAISGVNDIPPLITQVINVSAGEIV